MQTDALIADHSSYVSDVYHHPSVADSGGRLVIRYNTDRNQWQQWGVATCEWYDVVGFHDPLDPPHRHAATPVTILSYDSTWCEATLD